jgi:hypothetical protein
MLDTIELTAKIEGDRNLLPVLLTSIRRSTRNKEN